MIDARFYVIDESDGTRAGDSRPLEFGEAFERAKLLSDRDGAIKVLYTDGASQTEITRFAGHGLPSELLSGG